MSTHIVAAHLSDWVDDLQAHGRYTFTRADAAAVPRSEAALTQALGRLVKRGRIIAPRRGFYVVVPLEYTSVGAPPASWFIEDLLEYEEATGYVGLLTAAALHGAAHHAAQVFHVVVDSTLRPIDVGRQRIRFVQKADASGTTVQPWKTETGAMTVSTPEATALDLVRYPNICGELGNVATVLSELADAIDPKRLATSARSEPVANVQRLGWLFDHVEQHALGEALAASLSRRDAWWTPLVPGAPEAGCRYDTQWHVIVNAEIEVDT